MAIREIIFRGKRIDNGEWIEGYLICDREHYGKPDHHSYIVNHHHPSGCFGRDVYIDVDPSTIGQYTGLKDKNGKRIFEGDIVECWSEGVCARGTVQQRKDGLWIIFPSWQKTIMWSLCPDEYSNTSVEVVGNIHDDPEKVEV